MSKDYESKRTSPSIIARLMGMEALPPQKPALKQHNSSSESRYSVRKSALYEGCSLGNNSIEEQKFKDVFEVIETNKNNKLTGAKMDFFRQKVMDAKRFSSDEKLHGSKEFDDTLEVLDSNKDLFIKCLEERNSLFSKHLHALQGPPPQSHIRHMVDRKTLESRKGSSNHISLKLDRENLLKSHPTAHKKHCDDSLNRMYDRDTRNSLRSSRYRLEDEYETSKTVPTRIVVLKPNLGTSHSVQSPQSFQTNLPHKRTVMKLPNVKGEKKNVAYDDCYKSKESREIAKNITRKVKDTVCSSGSPSFSSSKFKGYVGDESSCYPSENDSVTGPGLPTMLTSRHSFDWNDWNKLSSSHSHHSSPMNRKAKKRLSERWNRTHMSEDMGLVGKNSTLGEMLAIPDADRLFDHDRKNFRFHRTEEFPEEKVPLGISSKEGWKNKSLEKLTRSKSLPTSSTFGSLKSNEAINLRRRRAVKKHIDCKEGLYYTSSRSSSRKGKSPHTYTDDSDHVPKTHACENLMMRSLEGEEDDYSAQITLVEASVGKFTEKGLAFDAVVDVEQESMVLSSEYPDELLAERSACISDRDDFPTRDLDNSTAKESSMEGLIPLSQTICEPESLTSSKVESEQPSPVSVLELPFTDDLPSGSECFVSLSADLQGLRMQLQLLKLESEEHEEGFMVISSDEDIEEEESTVITTGFGVTKPQENLDSSFILDILNNSEIYDSAHDTFTTTCHSLESPIHHSIFEEKVEIKYADQTSWSRSDRRLLFDRVNAGLFEIFQKESCPRPWIKRIIFPKMNKNMICKQDLYEYLENQEENAKTEDLSEKVLGLESQWLDLEDEIEVIGLEIEEMIIDEVMVEILSLM